MMAPVFRNLAEQYPDVVFLKVEVDMNEVGIDALEPFIHLGLIPICKHMFA